MSETQMPAVEANTHDDASERVSYELAFHVLPTVAEGEVSNVFQKLKDIITKHGGEITVEEAPARFDLAYEIVKYLEGRNRKFTSAYFGWVRFTADASAAKDINDAATGTKELLRHLLIKLTRTEEAHPFFFHEALEKNKVETIEIDEAPSEEVDSDKEDTNEDSETAATDDGEESTDKV